MRLVRRIANVYRRIGYRGVAFQVGEKLRYWHRRITFRPHIIHKTLAGHTFRVAINNLFAKGWVEDREQWPELEWIKQNLLHEGDLVVDCGANNGFTTIFFAHLVGPRGRVVAFEPLPSNARDVRQNISLNGLENVEVHEKAVGQQTGTVTLACTPNAIITDDESWSRVEVPIVRLDDAISQWDPTFIKIDVEGYELDVLRGAERILATNPKLDIEVHLILKDDKPRHCREVFEAVAHPNCELFVQKRPDGEIEAVSDWKLLADELCLQPVFHIYALPVRASNASAGRMKST